MRIYYANLSHLHQFLVSQSFIYTANASDFVCDSSREIDLHLLHISFPYDVYGAAYKPLIEEEMNLREVLSI